MPKFFNETEEGKVLYTGDGELIYYVPEKYFEVSVANIVGEYVETMGIFSYCNFSVSGKPDKMKFFKCPTIIRCKPSSIEKVNNFTIEGADDEPKSYRLLHFKKDAELLCSTAIPKDIANVEKFVNLLIRGNLPSNIPYNELHEYVIMNANLNGFNYKVSNQIIGILISELNRNPEDMSEPFRFSKMEDMLSYKAVPISKVPKYTSPYTAVTSENPDEAIAAAMTTTGSGKSPLEKVIMG